MSEDLEDLGPPPAPPQKTHADGHGNFVQRPRWNKRRAMMIARRRKRSRAVDAISTQDDAIISPAFKAKDPLPARADFGRRTPGVLVARLGSASWK